ncbi:sigma-54 interaction domain-containing protein [Brevibacillus choshinensis]|uniref:sigma-54 interaction domain-containing protein n=1 Tax=Brevibacillus choshinensis TaxID=54911 RepID=UPI002E236702|nr:sigma 54-interacting transcriptional regulator [Brevibacillus choshinensis]MED4582994.1 sigma 54-interacting transcriptional regulator [Brevibacillus choshinensis]MED4752910.1 sigma 54-interacting transcriptional regulator [Brevibacillus choshinensis]MED4781514.1 sigma 54-interacting transcriptional regulator [Brevibacillus choshinensis]
MEKDAQIIAFFKTSQLIDIFNTLADGIYISDAQGTTLWLNQASENLCGLPKSELIGRNVIDLEAMGIYKPSVTRLVIETGKPTTTIQLVNNKGKFLVTGHIIPDEKGNPELIVAHSRDITEAARASSQLEETVSLLKRYSEEIQLMKREALQNMSQALIGSSRSYLALLELVKKVAVVDTTVLITGETGVGKSFLAEHIHQLSDRCGSPFVHVNCSAIPETLIESELFGYQKGAFTGANQSGKIGLVKMADKGTLFLDEISELPYHLQSKLLLLLQNKTFMPIGGTKTYTADIRIIAATNANLLDLVRMGKFRHDLYYRLNILPINVPPMRERKEDIFPLLHHNLKKFNTKHHQKRRFSIEALDILHHYEWPGNVRELENLVERIVITAKEDEIQVTDLPEELRSIRDFEENIWSLGGKFSLLERLDKIEVEIISQALRSHKSTRKTATALGITQSLLMRRIKKYGILVDSDDAH